MKNPYFTGVDQAMLLNEHYKRPTLEQQYDSFNAALSSIASNIGQSKLGSRKGFLGNLASLAPVLSQGVQAYNVANKNAEAQNLAALKEAKADEHNRQLLASQEQKRKDSNFWKRRQNELAQEGAIATANYRKDKLNKGSGPSKVEVEQEEKQKENKTFDAVLLETKKKLEELGDVNYKGEKGDNGVFEQYVNNNFANIDLRNPTKAQLDSYGALIKEGMGKVYNIQTDVGRKAIVAPSSQYSLENNIAIMNTILKSRGLPLIKINKIKKEATINQKPMQPTMQNMQVDTNVQSTPQFTTMKDPSTGKKYNIPINEAEQANIDGLVLIKE